MARGMRRPRRMKSFLSTSLSVVIAIASPLGAALAFWACFGAMIGGCIDRPADPVEPEARLVVHWDPLACGDPHRVVIELEDDGGAPLGGSAPCNRGGVTLDVAHYGVYRGRIYAFALGEPARDARSVQLTIDASIVQWEVATPP